MPTIGEYSVSSAPSAFREVYDIIDEIVIKAGLTGREKFRFAVCITEAFTNACIHGNKQDPEKSVSLSFRTDEERLVATIEDEGAGRAGDIPQTLELKQIKSEKFSGRGVAIMHQFADKFNVVERTESGLKISLEWILARETPQLDAHN